MRCLVPTVMVVLLPALAHAGDGGPIQFRTEAEAFHYRSSIDGGGTASLSGMELRLIGSGPRWSLRVALPALSLSGPAGLVVLGSGLSRLHGGPGATRSGAGGAPAAAGQGSGGGPLFGALAADASNERQSGPGDLRIALARRLGHPTGFGRIALHGGVKLPTADESQGLGTGATDLWAGLTWWREGWVVDLEGYLEWQRLGDPAGFVLLDGPAAGLMLGWPIGRGGVRGGVEAARAALPGDAARLRGLLAVHGPLPRGNGWSAEAALGLSDSVPDLGLAAAFRF
jgi:hypothetical protein